MKTLGHIFVSVVFLALIVVSSGNADSNKDVAVERQIIKTPSGNSLEILVAGPESADAGVLLVHDWFGLTEFTNKAVARLGQLGYRAVAVDLYDGRSAALHPDAYALMQSVDAASARAKLKAALAYLRPRERRVATFGFSMGSTYALDTSLTQPESVSGTVIWYGATINDPERLSGLQSPVLAIYGSRDGNAADQAAAFSNLTDELNKSAEIYIYPGAEHAFAQPLFNGGKGYDPMATRAAWKLTEDFLERHLGK